MSDTTHDHERLDAIDLPTDLAEALGDTFGGGDRPTTLGDVVRDVDRSLVPDEPIEPSAYFRDEPTRHAVHLTEGVEYVPCVIDAFVLATLVDQQPVRIDSGSPVDGTVVSYRVTDDEVTATPTDAVVSLGIAPADVESPPDRADLADDPGMPSCAYINSFPDEGAYEAWAATTDAVAAMALSVDDAVAIARGAANGPMFATVD